MKTLVLISALLTAGPAFATVKVWQPQARIDRLIYRPSACETWGQTERLEPSFCGTP